MDNEIMITRYPNRRLYNTNSSEYINVSGIHALIKEGKIIKIIDKKTGEDLTKQYLLQIISEIENKDGKVLSESLLVEIIKNFNSSSQKLMPDMISKTFEVFRTQQDKFLKMFYINENNNFFENTSSKFIKDWVSYHDEFNKNIFNAWQKNNNNAEQHTNSDALSEKEEIDILKKQMSELRQELNKKK